MGTRPLPRQILRASRLPASDGGSIPRLQALWSQVFLRSLFRSSVTAPVVAPLRLIGPDPGLVSLPGAVGLWHGAGRVVESSLPPGGARCLRSPSRSCWRSRSGSAPRPCCRRWRASGHSATAARRADHRRAARVHRRHPRQRARQPARRVAGPRRSWWRARARRRSPTAPLALWVDSLGPALVLRFLTGVAMAGAYPPAMKIMATWFREGRGLAIGILVGALTVGSAAPHLIRGLTDLPWRHTLLAASVLALAGGAVVVGLRPRGTAPLPVRALRRAHGRRGLPRARRRGWPASATSATCGSCTRCGRGSACSWPRACDARGGGDYARAQRQRRHLPGDRHRRARLLGGRRRLRPVGPHDADDAGHGGERRSARSPSASPSAARRR